MAEPEEIIAFIEHEIGNNAIRKNLSVNPVLVTAGPTYEALDPVRFIGNHSSGKMGIAIATLLNNLGATVHLVLGPSKLAVPSAIKSKSCIFRQRNVCRLQKRIFQHLISLYLLQQ